MPLRVDSVYETPEMGVNAHFVANLTAYFVRQNAAYGIIENFGLAKETYQDWRELKRAEERQEFMANRAEILKKWIEVIKNRFREIRLGLKDDNLSAEEKQKLFLEAIEIDKQAAELAKELGVPYGRRTEQFTISRRN